MWIAPLMNSCTLQMIQGTCNSLAGLGSASVSGQLPPPLSNIAEFMAVQTDLLCQLVQGQQAIYQFLLQQYHQRAGHTDPNLRLLAIKSSMRR